MMNGWTSPVPMDTTGSPASLRSERVAAEAPAQTGYNVDDDGLDAISILMMGPPSSKRLSMSTDFGDNFGVQGLSAMAHLGGSDDTDAQASQGSPTMSPGSVTSSEAARHGPSSSGGSVDGGLRNKEQCRVCSDVSSGYHYGIMSCEGCKGFFKRSVQMNRHYQCRFSGSCNINKKLRNSCQGCRFEKCIAAGMSIELVRPDRTPGNRRKRPLTKETHSEPDLPEKDDCGADMNKNVDAAGERTLPTENTAHFGERPDRNTDVNGLITSSMTDLSSMKISQPPARTPEGNGGGSESTAMSETISVSSNSIEASSPAPSESHSCVPNITGVQEPSSPECFPLDNEDSAHVSADSAKPCEGSSGDSKISETSDPDLKKCSLGFLPSTGIGEPVSQEVLLNSLSPHLKSMVNTITESRPNVIPSINNTPECLTSQIFMNVAYSELENIVWFAKRQHRFNELYISDRKQLLRNSFLAIQLVRLSFRSKETNEGKIKFAQGMELSTDEALVVSQFPTMIINMNIELIDWFRSLQVDVLECGFLQSIILFSDDADCLMDRPFVRRIQNIYLEALREYSNIRFPRSPHRFASLLLRLPFVRKMALVCLEHFFLMIESGQITMSQLASELVSPGGPE